jgi:hypothetical protein
MDPLTRVLPYSGVCDSKTDDKLFDLSMLALRLGRFRAIPVRKQYGLCQVCDKVTGERTSHV